MSIKAVIFDVGGVIIFDKDHTKREVWEKRLGLAQGELTQIVSEVGNASQAASGGITEREIWREVGKKLGLFDAQIAEMQLDYWSGEELNVELVRFIRALRPRYKIGILSNAWSDARAFHNGRFRMNTWSDGAVYSAEVKLVKPDARIYQLILTTLGVRAEESIFVDDMLVNVQAAQALGMKGVQLLDTRQTIKEIQANLDETRA
jgi:epoxide hydrolase-like predicted phosphatase